MKGVRLTKQRREGKDGADRGINVQSQVALEGTVQRH